MQIDFTHVAKHYAPRTHEKMKEVLMDPDGKGPDIHYYMIRGGVDQKNITLWEPGTVSGEYIKTYGHYHMGKLDEKYYILFGQGIALLQKLSLDADGNMVADHVEKFQAIITKPGDEIYMAPGRGHLLVNTGKTYFITADDSPVNFGDQDPAGMPGHADYKLVKKMRGFAYYVVEHEGLPALKKNPNYKKIKEQDLGGLEVIK